MIYLHLCLLPFSLIHYKPLITICKLVIHQTNEFLFSSGFISKTSLQFQDNFLIFVLGDFFFFFTKWKILPYHYCKAFCCHRKGTKQESSQGGSLPPCGIMIISDRQHVRHLLWNMHPLCIKCLSQDNNPPPPTKILSASGMLGKC